MIPATELDAYVTPLPAHREPYPRQPKKTLYTLNVTPDGKGTYAPEICELTYPLMKAYAAKIGAEFRVITERTPSLTEWPVTIEKFQVAKLARERGDDWAIFFDADTLISPEFFDPTEHMSKETVAHNGNDMSHVRFKADNYFRRDGRWFGSCTWCVIASDLCVEDLWQLPQQSPEEAYANINITIGEHNSGQCKTEHLIDDYTLSRNIARFGLKATTLNDICGKLGWKAQDGRGINGFLWHKYTMTNEQKFIEMLGVLTARKDHAAFPFGLPGEQGPGPNGMPLLKLSVPSLYGPAGTVISQVGVGWGLMEPEYAQSIYRKYKK